MPKIKSAKKSKKIKQTKLSRTNMVLFALVFGAFGGFLIIHSFAAGSITWRGDFETGNFSQFSCGVQAKSSDRVSITSTIKRQGNYAARFHVEPGDNNVAGSGDNGERAEVCGDAPSPGTDIQEDKEQWYAWSTMFPSDFNYDSSGAWNFWTQFHNEGATGQANVGFNFTTSGTPKLNLRVMGQNASSPTQTNYPLVDFTRNKWYDIVLHIKWSSSPSAGFVEVWVNGQQVTPKTSVATLYAGQTAYWKQGYYRYAYSQPTTLYEDGARLGNSYDAVIAEFPDWGGDGGGPVTPTPTVSLSASPSSITSGSSSSLSWTSTNASSCTASGAWSGSKATSGSQSVSPTSTATYMLSCTGSGGSSSDSASITVSASPTPKPTIPSGLSAAPGDKQVTLNWNPNPSDDQVDYYQAYEGGQPLQLNILVTQRSYVATKDHNGNSLTNGTMYNFRISAHNSSGYGDWTDTISATPFAPSPQKPADLNNDGIVNITDLAMLLNKWGTADQTADINQDGIVNIFDLATLLNKWGS